MPVVPAHSAHVSVEIHDARRSQLAGPTVSSLDAHAHGSGVDDGMGWNAESRAQQLADDADRLRAANGTVEQRCRYLESVGLPAGLAEVLQEQEHSVGMRIYILDNSGSTGTHDGASQPTLTTAQVEGGGMS
jgi:hypothetical protein